MTAAGRNSLPYWGPISDEDYLRVDRLLMGNIRMSTGKPMNGHRFDVVDAVARLRSDLVHELRHKAIGANGKIATPGMINSRLNALQEKFFPGLSHLAPKITERQHVLERERNKLPSRGRNNPRRHGQHEQDEKEKTVEKPKDEPTYPDADHPFMHFMEGKPVDWRNRMGSDDEKPLPPRK